MNPFHYSTENQKPRPLVTWLIRIALFAGCLFTGMHNFSLYYRGLNGSLNGAARNAVAFGIAFILEASFYFSVEGRGRQFVTDEQRWASAYGAIGIFLIIAANTITDHATNLGKVGQGDWLNIWATYGAAGAVVGIIGYIGYLKAYAPEAMLAAEAAKAEAQRVKTAQREQLAVLQEPAIKERYKAQARKWALAMVDEATSEELPAETPAKPASPNGKSRWMQ